MKRPHETPKLHSVTEGVLGSPIDYEKWAVAVENGLHRSEVKGYYLERDVWFLKKERAEAAMAFVRDRLPAERVSGINPEEAPLSIINF